MHGSGFSYVHGTCKMCNLLEAVQICMGIASKYMVRLDAGVDINPSASLTVSALTLIAK